MEAKGKRNAYICEKCGGTMVTVNLEDGVTPFMVKCRLKWPEECEGMAKSQFYRIDQSTPPDFCWYRPTADDLDKQDDATKDHVKHGGLLLRRLRGLELQTHGGRRIRRG